MSSKLADFLAVTCDVLIHVYPITQSTIDLEQRIFDVLGPNFTKTAILLIPSTGTIPSPSDYSKSCFLVPYSTGTENLRNRFLSSTRFANGGTYSTAPGESISIKVEQLPDISFVGIHRIDNPYRVNDPIDNQTLGTGVKLTQQFWQSFNYNHTADPTQFPTQNYINRLLEFDDVKVANCNLQFVPGVSLVDIESAGGSGAENKLTIGGDAKSIAITAGTLDDQNLTLIRNNLPVFIADSTTTNLISFGNTTIVAVDDVQLESTNGIISLKLGADPNAMARFDTSIKSAEQYALDIANDNNAVPNVQFVLDNAGGNGDVVNGGQPTGDLILGTIEDEPVVIKAFNQNVALFDTIGQIVASQPNYENLVTSSLTNNILVNRKYVTDLNNLKVSKSGDTMTGTLNMGTFGVVSSYIPTVATDLTNKLYVDSGVATLANKSLVDSTTFFTDNATPSKRMQFQLDTVATGVTRTLTVPDADGTILLSTIGPIVQNGNTLGTAVSIGTNDNFDVNIRRNGINAYTFTSTGLTMNPQGVTTGFFLRAPIASGIAGSLSIVAGTAIPSPTPTAGGSISLLAGNAAIQGGAAADAGTISLTAGFGTRRVGGDINLTAGYSNDGSVNNLRGGNINLTTGICIGGVGAIGLKGGDLNFTASGGTVVVGQGRVGAGNINIVCQPMSGTTTNPGGIVTISASEGVAGGPNGSIRLYHKTNVGVTVEGDGTLSTNTPTYEALVLNDNDFPNRKFVVDRVLGSHPDTTFSPLVAGDIIRYSGSAWNNVQSARGQMYWTNNAIAENGGLAIATNVTVRLGSVAISAETIPQFLKNFTHVAGTTNQLTYTGTATIIAEISYGLTSFPGNNDRGFLVECFKSGVVIPQSRLGNIAQDNTLQADDCSKTFLETISTGNTFDVRVTNLGADSEFTAKEYILSIKYVDVA